MAPEQKRPPIPWRGRIWPAVFLTFDPNPTASVASRLICEARNYVKVRVHVRYIVSRGRERRPRQEVAVWVQARVLHGFGLQEEFVNPEPFVGGEIERGGSMSLRNDDP